MKKKKLKTGKRAPELKRGKLVRAQRVVRHDGDCSIHAYGKRVCDCGALRKAIRAGRITGDEAIWSDWVRHVDAIPRV